MRKILVCTLISALVLGVTACGSSKSSNVDKEMLEASVAENTNDTKSSITPEETETMKEENNNTSNSDSNILIAYFTWADNTHVDNPDSIDVDATTKWLEWMKILWLRLKYSKQAGILFLGN